MSIKEAVNKTLKQNKILKLIYISVQLTVTNALYLTESLSNLFLKQLALRTHTGFESTPH